MLTGELIHKTFQEVKKVTGQSRGRSWENLPASQQNTLNLLAVELNKAVAIEVAAQMPKVREKAREIAAGFEL